MAHRGASALEAENTIPAFLAAVSAGADAVEFDVRMSADGTVFVMHDPDVSRTTDGAGLVKEMSASDMRRLRIRGAGSDALAVPTLAEALSSLSGRVAVDIEIKNIPGEPDFDPSGESLVEATVAALESFEGEALLSSFNPFSLNHAREIAPDLSTGFLTTDDVDALAAMTFALDNGFAWILPSSSALARAGQALIDDAHAAGLRIGTWIVDDPREAVALIAMGLDAIATNDPASIVRARNAMKDAPEDATEDVP